MQLKQILGKLKNEASITASRQLRSVHHSGTDYDIIVSDYEHFNTLVAEVINKLVIQYFAVSFEGNIYICMRSRPPSAKISGKLPWTEENIKIVGEFSSNTLKEELLFSVISCTDFEYEHFKLKSLNEEVKV